MRAEDRARGRACAAFVELEREAHPFRARAQHGDHLRVAARVDEEDLRLALGGAPDERHRLGRGGRLVQQRGVRHRQAGEVDHGLLEGEQGLEPALRDLGLVGRVGGVPARVLEHVALDHLRRVAGVVAGTDAVAPDFVFARDRAQLGQRLRLIQRRWQLERRALADRRWQRLVQQRRARGEPERGEHLALGRRIDAEVARLEFRAAHLKLFL